MSEDKFLLQHEVAERLRCSMTTVKRLRTEGKLAYLPGRPVKIRERDLQAYIEAEMIQAQKPKPAPVDRPHGMSAVEANARLWAMNAVLFKREPRKPKK